MTAISDLQTALQTEVNKIGNAILKARANVVLEDYINASNALSALSAKTMDSYSISNRTFSVRNVDALQKYVLGLESDLMRLCYGNITTSSIVMNPDYQSYKDASA
jgi:hypothetical protein